jgi:hypothetical protein
LGFEKAWKEPPWKAKMDVRCLRDVQMNEARGIFVYHFLEGWNNGMKEGSALQMIQSDTTDKTQLNIPPRLT